MDINKRVIVVFLGVLVMLISTHACRVTTSKQAILHKGEIVKTKITKTTSDGSSKTINVKISDVEYSAGEAFGDYNNKVAGDTISVHYLKSKDYVLLEGQKTFLNAFIFQIIVVLGGLLVVYGIFSKDNSYKRYLPYTMDFDFETTSEPEK